MIQSHRRCFCNVVSSCINTKNNIKAVVKPIEGDRKPGLRLNNSKMKALGWRVGISLEDGIKDVVKKYMG